ncbi:MAG: phosphatidate cytidylyltransferase [Bacteroidetes bacterium]|nr:phosphatidate cytidylyltransferase [Bacteroidota bacterium]
MNNFLKRSLTGGAFVLVLLGCTWFNQLSFSILFFVVTILGQWEFYTLSEKGNNRPLKVWGTIAGALIFTTNTLVCMGYDHRILALNIPIVFMIFILELFTKASNPFRNIAFTILGIVYVAIPFSILNYLVTFTGTYNYELLFGFFFILWSNDSGAYLAGSAFGKRKLFARVSPGKSWEGSIGGAIAAYIVVFIISKHYTSISIFDWMCIATILIVIGTLGDLVESLYKRSKNVKDSGTLLPGHGGILDRFDSLLMATPFVFSYLYLTQLFS